MVKFLIAITFLPIIIKSSVLTCERDDLYHYDSLVYLYVSPDPEAVKNVKNVK